MTLSLALNNALSGLSVSQKALSVVSQNIANANTAGYSRQILDQSAVYVGDVGEGVKAENVNRKVDQYLRRSVLTQNSEVGRTGTIKTYMNRLQQLLGQPGADNSLDAYATSFFNDIQTLATAPDSVAQKTTTVDSAITLSQQISGLAGGLQDLRYQTDQDMKAAVRTLNSALQTIDSLNISIGQATALGDSTAGLQDSMDKALNTVSSYMDIQTTQQTNGSIHVYTTGGAALVDDNLYQLRYTAAAGEKTFEKNGAMNPLTVVRIKPDGSDDPRNVTTLISGGDSSQVTTTLTSGSLLGMQQLRDKQIPGILDQLDNMAANLRDAFNAIHNDGSSYPGTDSLTGTRAISATDRSDWSGTVTIGLMDANGNPVTSPYPDETDTGIRPLKLDLSKLNSGFGEGQPTMQTIVDEINNHFFPPAVKAELGNLNNIQLVSNTSALPDVPPQVNFDFDLDNISKNPAQFFVTGVTVADDTGTNITATTSTVPKINLNGVNTYTTTAGSNTVQINASTIANLHNGDIVYLSDPVVAVDGIPASNLTGYFQVSNVTAGTFEITTATPAALGTNTSVAGITATQKWDTVAAGNQQRTRDNGTFTADLSGNPASTYYDITINTGVYDGTTPAGSTPNGTITYRIYNNQQNLLNDRYDNTAVTGNARRVIGGTSQPSLVARLVDANGTELPKTNGVYGNQQGYLQIETFDPTHTVALDEGDSKQQGITSTSPAAPGTGRGFSHFFELNDFFASNDPTPTGDTVKGSALALHVEDRITNDANLVSLGTMVPTTQPTDPSKRPQYTVERDISDNSVIQKLAKLGISAQDFAAAGTLATTSQTYSGYAGQILGNLASTSATASSNADNSQTLYDGFNDRLNSATGVNIDEELASTIIYQHAYTASAHVITVTNQLFDTLLNMTQ